MMLRNDEIQKGLVAYLKTKTSITSLLKNGATEIREDQWQGNDFGYPCVRIKLLPSEPYGNAGCPQSFSVSFLVFSDDASSQEADKIAGIINNELHGKQFTSNSIAFLLRSSKLIPSIRSDTQTWRAETLMIGIAS